MGDSAIDAASGQSIGRNARCACGSGRRYKDCCGGIAAQVAGNRVRSLMRHALGMQQARRLDDAERFYREALALNPNEPDVLHMLGVIRYERQDPAEALALIRHALDLTEWRFPAIRHNFGLVLAALCRDRDDSRRRMARASYRQWLAELGTQPARLASVAVVVPNYNHAAFVEHALASLFAQTQLPAELVVIDDGSSDGSAAIIARVLADVPFPARIIVRENRGAPATINEAVAMTSSEFVNVLNSDDAFEPDRLARMTAAVAGRTEWGFSSVALMDEHDRPIDVLQHARGYAIACAQGAISLAETPGFALLTNNVAVTSGNLFFSRRIFDALGGFRDFRYNHDWDFALRAVALTEPALVPVETYRYRLHARNTIDESSAAARAEADRILGEFLERASSAVPFPSPHAPSGLRWGSHFIVTVLESGMASVLDPNRLRALADGFAGLAARTDAADS
ncbi:MAG: glycosyltransferase [Casimicrobiaceae bacterium]